jgi:hypothetical protein
MVTTMKDLFAATSLAIVAGFPVHACVSWPNHRVDRRLRGGGILHRKMVPVSGLNRDYHIRQLISPQYCVI